MAQLDTHELAWAAGLFDGEGTVGLRSNGPRQPGYRRIGLRVGMTTKEDVIRWCKAIRISKVLGPRIASKYPDAKPIWECRVDNFEGVQFVCALLWKWLGKSKREQFAKAILGWKRSSHRNKRRAFLTLAEV